MSILNIILGSGMGVYEPGSITYNTPGSYNWTAPSGVYSVTVELWGGGGSGGNAASGSSYWGGGGAGGQYAMKVVTVSPGTTYGIYVADTQVTANRNGNDTTFATSTVVAKGGMGGGNATSSLDGSGGHGSTSGGVGDTVYAGGNGDGGYYTGCGGGGAGSTGAGGNYIEGHAGVGTPLNGGDGGDWGIKSNNGGSGNDFGGGGAGGRTGSVNISYYGSPGAQGLAILTW